MKILKLLCGTAFLVMAGVLLVPDMLFQMFLNLSNDIFEDLQEEWE